MRAFADGPSVVAARLNPIDLLVRLLAHIAEPEVARRAVEAPPPGVTEPPRVNLRTAASCEEWVRGRDPVRQPCAHVDPEQLPREDVHILRARPRAVVP